MFELIFKNNRLPVLFNLHFFRLVRSVAPISKSRKYPKFLKGGQVVDLDEKSADLFGPVENYAELNRKLRKMFIESEEVPNEMEMAFQSEYDDYSDVIRKADLYHDMHEKEEKRFKSMIEKKKGENKFFKRREETNLLTYAAKTQIRYLHDLNPTKWTPETLAECFPSSIRGIKSVLKQERFTRLTEEKIKEHDALVEKHWKYLKTNRKLEKIEPFTLKLWNEGKIIRDFYSGNINLPKPPLKKPDFIFNKPEKVGEYASMVIKYVETKKNAELAKLKQENSTETESENMLHELTVKYPKASEIQDRESASYLAVDKVDSTDSDLLSDQFQENLLEEFSSKQNKTPAESTYQEWMENLKSNPQNVSAIEPYNPKDFSVQIKKFNDNTIELSGDQIQHQEASVSYLYDSTSGYQYPFGKDIVQDQIRIPKKLYKKDAIYKVRSSYYDHRGRFLYRLPFDM